MPEIILHGCAPFPLAHYLKALGILRLLGEDREHGDREAAGCWRRDVFELHTKLGREALLDFFLRHYRPTPILAPWNGGGGFYLQEEKSKVKDPESGKRLKTGRRTQETEATRTVGTILRSTAERLAAYRDTILRTRAVLSSRGLTEAPAGREKDELLIELRNLWPDTPVQWLDCVAVLTNAGSKARSESGLKPNYTTLLGSGANDGNADFTSNFMQRLGDAILRETPEGVSQSRRWLVNAMFAENLSGARISALAGQFSPGSAGNANNTAGFKGKSWMNPWDYILMMEGTLIFAAAAVRKLEDSGQGGIAFPFCVSSAGAGYASCSSEDEVADNSSTEEIWLPLWDQPTGLVELLAVFGEGRAQVGTRNARTGVDFARAAVTLGVDRGIDSFQRYGFLVRNGKSVFATPLERLGVRRNARADLLSEADAWVTRLRDKAGATAKQAPASMSRALKQVEARILDLCRQNDAGHLQAVLVALGQAERAVARSLRWTTETAFLRPLSGLSARWLAEADTGSREFRLAASLASLNGKFGNDWLPLRCHLEPVLPLPGGGFKWAENSTNDVQWSDGALPLVLNAIFARRLVRAEKAGSVGFPGFALCPASCDDVAAFIEGETDDTLLGDLVWGLCLLGWGKGETNEWLGGPRERATRAPAPSLYALLKLCFPSESANDESIPMVPAIHRHACAGDGVAASRLAVRRLRASGLSPAVGEIPLRGEVVQRTAAALLFPLATSEWAEVRETVLRPADASSD